MSNGRSIDGLQRRSSPKNSKNRTTTSTVMTRRSTKKPVTVSRSTIQKARPTNKQPNATVSRIGGARKNTPQNIRERSFDDDFDIESNNAEIISDIDRIDEINNRELGLNDRSAVKDFLSEVRDTDPTDLSEVPLKERKARKMKKQKKKGKKKILRWVILVIVLLLIGGGVAAYFYFDSFVADVTNGGNLITMIFSDPTQPLEQDENGRTNVLVFGTEGYDMDDPQWSGGFLTDSMMLLSLDQETGDVKAISLPRDLKERTCTATGKLNEVFWCTYSKNDGSAESVARYEEEGAKALADTFERILGVKIHYYSHLNWMALIQIVDAIGGIDVVFTYGDQTWDGDEVTIETSDKRGLMDRKGKEVFYSYPNGEVVHLDGEHALAVARTRNAFGGYGAMRGNFSREYFQQRIIEAIAKKIRKTDFASNLGSVLALKSAVGDNLRTNFKDTEIKTLLKLAKDLDFSGIETIPLYGDETHRAVMTTGTVNGISYVLPTAGAGQYSQIHNYIKEQLYADPAASESASITVLNGSGETGVAAEEKDNLATRGFSVKETANAPEDQSGFDGYRIYAKSGDKKNTLASLEKLYNTQAITELPESLASYDCDFIIVIGNKAK